MGTEASGATDFVFKGAAFLPPGVRPVTYEGMPAVNIRGFTTLGMRARFWANRSVTVSKSIFPEFAAAIERADAIASALPYDGFVVATLRRTDTCAVTVSILGGARDIAIRVVKCGVSGKNHLKAGFTVPQSHTQQLLGDLRRAFERAEEHAKRNMSVEKSTDELARAGQCLSQRRVDQGIARNPSH